MFHFQYGSEVVFIHLAISQSYLLLQWTAEPFLTDMIVSKPVSVIRPPTCMCADKQTHTHIDTHIVISQEASDYPTLATLPLKAQALISAH